MKQTIISVRRHEEKDGKHLSENGKRNSFHLGLNLMGLIEAYHSPVPRSEETVDGIIEGYRARSGNEIKKIFEPKLDVIDCESDYAKYGSDRDLLINTWMENFYENNGTMFQAGANVLKAAYEAINGRTFDDGSRLEFISHAPNVESSILTLTDPRQKIEDIGGSFAAGEGYEIFVTQVQGNVVYFEKINIREQRFDAPKVEKFLTTLYQR